MMSGGVFRRVLGKVARGDAAADVANLLLAESDPWLHALYAWAVAERGSGNGDEAGRKVMGDGSGQDEVMERLFLLRRIALFDEVSADQLLPLAHVARRQGFAAGQVIFEEGATGDSLYLVLDGEVIVEVGGRLVATLGRSECFGEMALLDESPRSASVRASGPVECLVVDRVGFDDLLEVAPGMARGVIRVLTQRLRATLEDPH